MIVDRRESLEFEPRNPMFAVPALNDTEPLRRDPVIDAFRKDIDRTLFERNLTLSVEQRFLQLMELQRFAESLRAAGRRAKRA